MAQTMNTRQVAEYVRLHEPAVSKYAAQGRIPAVRIGKFLRFGRNAVDE
jgi:excisionase family DNA binding protein